MTRPSESPSSGARRLRAPLRRLLRTSLATTQSSLAGGFSWGALLLVLPIIGLGFYGEASIERAFKRQLAKELEGTLSAAVAGLELWLEACRRSHQAALSDERVVGAAACFAGHSEDESCSRSFSRSVAPYLSAIGGDAFLVTLDPPRVVRAKDERLGDRARGVLLQQVRARHESGWKHGYLPPFALSEERALSGYLGRLPSQAGDSYVLLEVPAGSLSRSMLAARWGETGETYGVDAAGRMVTNSRFLDDLRLTGLLRPTEDTSVLRVDVRDPGVDLTQGHRSATLRSKQPRTTMAAAIARGDSGSNVDGYRDYRGVPVIGAWRWLEPHGLGVATEVDAREAFAPLGVLRTLFFSLIGVLSSVAIGGALLSHFLTRARRRAAQAVRDAKELGQYQIERKLGEGGMGTVYLARHALLKRPTAVKVVRQERTSPEAVRRFEREVRATSELSHPNTVSIYDYGIAEDGTFFYAMEYLEGLDVQQIVRRFGPQPEARVVHLLLQACSSLAEAHARKLVHRDIKPSNIFVCGRESLEDLVKVLDFGIVKTDDGETDPITRASTLIGTPEYMPPEMFDRAQDVGPQGDVYALGAVGYYLLSGKPVFGAVSMAELCRAHLTEDPVPPSERGKRELDPELEEIVLACLDKTPSARPRGARGLRRLLLELRCAHTWTPADARRFWAGVDEANRQAS